MKNQFLLIPRSADRFRGKILEVVFRRGKRSLEASEANSSVRWTGRNQACRSWRGVWSGSLKSIRRSGFIVLIFCSFLASAREPDSVCLDNPGYCSDQQLAIEVEFLSGKALDGHLIGEVVFSGSCYHKANGYNPSHEHWGFMFFDWKDEDAYFGGRYGFLHPKNPYREITPERARRELNVTEKPDHVLKWTESYNFAHINQDSGGLWLYWFSQNQETDHMYLKAYLSAFHLVYCELTPNQFY